MTTDVNQFITDLDGSVFASKVAAVLSEVAHAVVTHDKLGEVTLKFKMKRIAETNQVMVDHTIVKKAPTAKGSKSEDNLTSTPMHVGNRGQLSLFPQSEWDAIAMKGKEHV